MPRVHFTPHLARFVDVPVASTGGGTVGESLAEVFGENPRLRDYVLDEHGRVRPHVTVFVDGARLRDRLRLADPVGPDAEIHVLQALSGG